MSKVEKHMAETRASIPERTTPSADECYDDWAKAKIENALKEARAHPELRMPLEQVWKKFGLER